MDSVGGQMAAATGKENANYGIKVLDEHLGLAVDVLSDVVLHPKFAPADIEREKSVVAEEIKMVEDMPDDLVHELFIERFWAGHPLGRSILGTPDSVEALTREALQAYFSRVHTASNFVVAAAGSFDYERLRDLVQEAFGSLPRGGGEPEDAPPSAHGVLLVRTKDLEQSHVCLGAGACPEPREPVPRSSSTAARRVDGLRLFQNVQEKRGLAYSVSSGFSAFGELLTIYAGCANTKWTRWCG